MSNELDILNKIRLEKENFSKSNKKIAEYILDNHESVAFLTAAELGKAVGVSESTIVRFPAAIGLSGYPELIKTLGQMVKDKIQEYNRIDIAKDDLTDAQVLEKVMRSDADKILVSLSGVEQPVFDMAVHKLMEARNVYIIGLRNCAGLAIHFAYYLNLIRGNVHAITSCNNSEVFEQMIHIGSEDVVVGISFPRYSMRTLKALEFASDRLATIIAFSDSKYSPINMYSSINLTAKCDMASVVESMTAPMSLVNALIVACSTKEPEKVLNNIETLNEITENYQFNSDDELDIYDDEVIANLREMANNE